MTSVKTQPGSSLRGTATLPGDKSISHRSVMFAAFAKGQSQVKGFLHGRDCLATVECMRSLGLDIEFISDTELRIDSPGREALTEPLSVLDCDNSGTTMRLLAGLLAPQPFASVLVGTPQLQKRPMARITKPLRAMNAQIIGRQQGRLAPLAIAGTRQGGELRGIDYDMPVASAQVKSAIMLAGLGASQASVIHEIGPSRDHSERLLMGMEAPITLSSRTVSVSPLEQDLKPLSLTVPADISSAAFLLVAACCLPESDITLEGVGVNPTRTGLIEALKRMGAQLDIINERDEGGEPVADIRARSSELRGASFGGDDIVTMIDEIPVLAVAATQAQGETHIREAEELRVKESDRIAVTVGWLRGLGADVEEHPDGLTVRGGPSLKAAPLDSAGDHRQAMAQVIAGLLCEDPCTVTGCEVIPDSFPGFEAVLKDLGALLDL